MRSERCRAACVPDLRSAYDKAGWKGFDPNAKPYSADDVRQYRSSWQ